MPTAATYRRRRAGAVVIAVVLLAVGFYAPLTLLAPLHGVSAAIAATPDIEPAAATTLALPSYGASAVTAIGYPQATASAGRTDAVPMASISKIVTALVVLQAKPLRAGEEGPSITMSPADAALYGHYLALNGDVVTVRAGYVFSELDLLKLALIKSANNYAASLANWAFGSTSAYAAAATTWLGQHGLTGIHVVEPTGIDPHNVGTATDLVRLGELALQNPVIAPIVRMTHATLPNVGDIKNTNGLIGDQGVDGIKTGTLDHWGANLLFSSSREVEGTRVTIVGVVLGGADHPSIDRDIAALIGQVTSGFHRIRLTTPGQVFGGYRTAWGDRADLVAATAASVLVWGAAQVTVKVDAEPVTTAAKGTRVGTARFTVAGTTTTVDLKLSRRIDDPGWGWRLAHPEVVFGAI